ncbi:MAG: hypothetical protein LBJ10_08315 [Clostridiales bacterium]|nr:hypothetical protein [Clostridiales bacterium]
MGVALAVKGGAPRRGRRSEARAVLRSDGRRSEAMAAAKFQGGARQAENVGSKGGRREASGKRRAAPQPSPRAALRQIRMAALYSVRRRGGAA